MDLKQERSGGIVVVGAPVRVDHGNAEEFRVALWPLLDQCRAGADAVVLDLRELEYISSAGLRVLMLAARRVTDQQGQLALAALQPVVREIFQIARFDKVFPLHDTVAGAIAQLARPPAATG